MIIEHCYCCCRKSQAQLPTRSSAYAGNNLMTTTMTTNATAKYYHFVIVPKLKGEAPFFAMVGQGCHEYAKQKLPGIAECHYIGYPEANAVEQARVIRELVTDPTLHGLEQKPDGISIAVLNEEITGEAIDFVYDAGVPVITFDSDAPTSKRQAFVSTDNYAFGLELGKVLDQLFPKGGKFGQITGNGPNLIGRLNGVRDRLLNDALNPTKWTEVDYSPLNCENNVTLANELMHQYAADPSIQAIIPVGGWPMFNPTLWKEFVDQNRNISTVCGDSTNAQIELMSQGYVDGLVGQLPYQMGEFSARELYNINEDAMVLSQEVMGTHMLEILRVPLQLPAYTIDPHYLGSLVFLGYTLFGIVAVMSLIILIWVRKHSKASVIRASQPPFLAMVCVGTLILGSAILPLAVDDHNASQHVADAACMAFPWCVFIGFSVAFAALFSKQWRIVKLLQSAEQMRRVTVTVVDVLAPFTVLMTVNIVTLICWTLIAPLKYVRRPMLGTDDWNRVIGTYGGCSSANSDTKGGSTPYLVILACVNGCVLAVANLYAYRSRKIHTEFSESRYIALVNASILQAAMIGLPVAFLIAEQPTAYFLVMSLLIFVVCMAILAAIFYPKYRALTKPAEPNQGTTRAIDSRYFGKNQSSALRKSAFASRSYSSSESLPSQSMKPPEESPNEAPPSVEEILKLIENEPALNVTKKTMKEVLLKALQLRAWQQKELSNDIVFSLRDHKSLGS